MQFFNRSENITCDMEHYLNQARSFRCRACYIPASEVDQCTKALNILRQIRYSARIEQEIPQVVNVTRGLENI